MGQRYSLDMYGAPHGPPIGNFQADRDVDYGEFVNQKLSHTGF